MYNMSNISFSLIPYGAIEKGKELLITLWIPNVYGFAENVQVLFHRQYEPVYQEICLKYVETLDEVSSFQAKFSLNRVGINYFHFSMLLNQKSVEIHYDWATKKPCFTSQNGAEFSITVYEQGFDCPEWAKEAVMYHIFVDRFRKGKNTIILPMPNRVVHQDWNEYPIWFSEDGEVKNNDFFGGNLKGIKESIHYLKKMGITILYLSPIARSQSNHRYDTGDYEEIDPYAGTEQELKELCKTAHQNGMKVILDAVFNHTGNDSKYFNEYHHYQTLGAFDGPSSPYYEWYRKNGTSFEYWWGFRNLPVCDGTNLSWQQYIYGKGGVIDKWFSWGIDGIRIDVADELTEEFLENIHTAVICNQSDGFIIGEVWENAITKQKYGKERSYLLGKTLHTVMNYPFTDGILKYVRFGDAPYLKQVVNEILTAYPKSAYHSMTNALSTHDIPRALTTLAGEGIFHNRYEWTWDIGDKLNQDWKWRFEHDQLSREAYRTGKKLLKLAVLIQFFLPGTACIFYGDEVGMQGYKDNGNRKTYPWTKRDKDLLRFYRKIGTLKAKLTFLKNADCHIIYGDEQKFVFERTDQSQTLIVAINRTKKQVTLQPEWTQYAQVLYSNHYTNGELGPYGEVVLLKNCT